MIEKLWKRVIVLHKTVVYPILISMTDRKIGYCILILITIAITSCSVYFGYLIWKPQYNYIIAFNEAGTLKQGDPVTIRGFSLGYIQRILHSPGKTLVTIRTEKSLQFYDNYRITTFEKGIMGYSCIALFCGTQSHRLLKNTDTLNGSYTQTISELLSDMSKIREFVHSVNSQTIALVMNSGSKPTFIQQAERSLRSLDSLTDFICSAVDTLSRSYATVSDSIQKLTAHVGLVTTAVQEFFSHNMQSFSKYSMLFTEYMAQLNALISLCNELIPLLEKYDGSFTIHRALLLKYCMDMQKILLEIQNGMLPVKIKLKME